MLKRTSQAVAGVILILLPSWPITENFFPPENQVDNQTFPTYILLCSSIILAGLGLVFFQTPRKTLAGWLLFAGGMTSIFPLHLGPPRENEDLLKFSDIEQFRYGMLIVAVLLFFAGCYALMFSTEMQKWKDVGKDASVFFVSYDYHMPWRTAARVSLYLVAAWLSILLLNRLEIRKWQFTLLMIFNIFGVSLCMMSLLISPHYYFPFMVPAIALSPAYWIGLMLLFNKTRIRI